MAVFFDVRGRGIAIGCFFACVWAGCNHPTVPAQLPVAPQPADGSGSVDVNHGKSAAAWLDFAVSGRFTLRDQERNPAPLHVRIFRSGDPKRIVQNSTTTRAIRDGDGWGFECKIRAPKKPGDYEVIVFTDKYEIARGKINVIPR